MITVTMKLCVPVAESVSVAVTVMVAVPVTREVMVTLLPSILTVATPVLDDSAEKVSRSPLGSENLLATGTFLVNPFLYRVTLEMVPTATGGWLITVAVKSWVAVSPSGSVAVTMILPVDPVDTGAIVTVLPEMLTVTIEGFGELTE